ncbi:uncharacterized protein B0T23DRAFT_378541 [Neurospora hispaniola]|uniref:Uncharacterized protein n=1 Tax=Neurospora hispaniola TaxID=588809 RepID=A0AAJ0MSZ7_9PEZI|nr:hypothetical protein B0T23DRAFT_378541 [Neurospora hispaniola]
MITHLLVLALKTRALEVNKLNPSIMLVLCLTRPVNCGNLSTNVPWVGRRLLLNSGTTWRSSKWLMGSDNFLVAPSPPKRRLRERERERERGDPVQKAVGRHVPV